MDTMAKQAGIVIAMGTAYVCHECQKMSGGKPKKLPWGHECWSRDRRGGKINACESRIEEVPTCDLFEVK